MTILWYSNDGIRWECVAARDRGEFETLVRGLTVYPYIRVTTHVADIGAAEDRDAGPRTSPPPGPRPDQLLIGRPVR